MRDLELNIFHIGGGDDSLGLAEAMLRLQIPIKLFVFEIIDDSDYTSVDKFNRIDNVTATVIPTGIGGVDNEKVVFNVNKHPLSSSCLRPAPLVARDNPGYGGIADWAENTDLASNFSANLRTLDSLVREGAVPLPDFISMDIQGLELEALKGAEECLSQAVLGLALESEFIEIYEGQGLFDDQLSYLRLKGFRFADFLTRQEWHQGPVLGRGFFTVAESLFLKHFVSPDFEFDGNGARSSAISREVGAEKMAKLALIAYSFHMYSYFLFIMLEIRKGFPEYWEKLEHSNAQRFTSLTNAFVEHFGPSPNRLNDVDQAKRINRWVASRIGDWDHFSESKLLKRALRKFLASLLPPKFQEFLRRALGA